MDEWTDERKLTITLAKEDWQVFDDQADEEDAPLEAIIAGVLGRVARDRPQGQG